MIQNCRVYESVAGTQSTKEPRSRVLELAHEALPWCRGDEGTFEKKGVVAGLDK